ncbi:DUF4956 domain-containing protein [Nakamurella deserti]|uniref:DUF4956 domain-containing protein n=1 Tax=Nakamurella deserti TaxID=2164074 RepID=UPI000DBE7879|nr:DUF4956 domain-containing protein [Nakamurella deserti]
MPDLLILAVDLIAVAVLVFGVYHRRHRGRDMLLPLVGLNVGVLAVCAVLSGIDVSVGVGLGLFGVLAIIRLRSSEISHDEVAYYFAALALGLVCGLQPTPQWLAPALSAVIVGVFALVDQPRVHHRYRHQLVTLDAVYHSEAALVRRLEDLLTGEVQRIVVISTDLVRDLTVVDVRYRRHPAADVPADVPADDAMSFVTAPLRPGSR